MKKMQTGGSLPKSIQAAKNKLTPTKPKGEFDSYPLNRQRKFDESKRGKIINEIKRDSTLMRKNGGKIKR